MKLKTILLLAVAVGCGLVAMLGVQQSMNGTSQSETEEKVSVLMAVTDIGVGEVLTPENVTFRAVAVDTAPENSVLTEDEYKDRSATVEILANDFVTLAKLSEPGISGPSVAIPMGMRVVTVPVNDTTSHSGMMAPGDRVDVLVTYQSRTTRGQTTQTKVLLEFIEIFATGNKTASDSRGEAEQKIKNVSLLVTPEQMPYVKLAEKKGNLSLSWRRKDDDEFVKVGAVDEDLMHELQGTLDKDHRSGYPSYEMIGGLDPEDGEGDKPGLRTWIDEQRELSAAAEAEAAAAAEKEAALLAAATSGKPTWKMEIFHGDKRSLVELVLPEDADAEPLDQDSTTGEADKASTPPVETEPVNTDAGVSGLDWQSLLKGLASGSGT